jgi:hypothetical protein
MRIVATASIWSWVAIVYQSRVSYRRKEEWKEVTVGDSSHLPFVGRHHSFVASREPRLKL